MVKFLGSGVIARMVNSITDAANESAVTRLTRKLQILDTVNLMLNYVIVWLFGWGIALL